MKNTYTALKQVIFPFCLRKQGVFRGNGLLFWTFSTFDDIKFICFQKTSVSVAQSDAMVKKHHVYMTKNGRISIAGITSANVQYVADSIKEALNA